MNRPKTCLLAALLAAAPLAHAGTLHTPSLWGKDYPKFECVISNVEHPVSAVVQIDIYADAATPITSGEVTVAPGETGIVSYTAMVSGTGRCSFSIPGPSKDLKDFRGAIRIRDQYNAPGPALPAS